MSGCSSMEILLICVHILLFTEHEQDTLQRESVDSTEQRPRKKKS